MSTGISVSCMYDGKRKWKYCCQHHEDRIAAVSVYDIPLCWECYLGRKRFVVQFGENFYKDADEVKNA